MSQDELRNATDLVLVRQIRNLIDTLDQDVGELIPDEEHAQVRRIVRDWERRIDASIKVRRSYEKRESAEAGGK